jgi:hypothetical protein
MASSVTPATERVTPELARLIFEKHDNCVSCGYAFREGDTSFSGYGADDEPLYVCSNCAGMKLREIARRTYYMARHYKVPEPAAVLWRYMDFTKYASLLSTKSLYFPSAACFDDVFEGAKGLAERKHKWDSHYLDFFRRAIRSAPRPEGAEITEEAIETNAQKLLHDIEMGGNRDRDRTFISCWHESRYESEAMWKLYSTSMSHAVAIQTTVADAYAALGKNPKISIGRVEYVDFETYFADINGAFWKKRKAFEHEREVRLLLSDRRQLAPGLALPCDIPTLVQSVVVSPKAPDWFLPLVEDLTAKFGFQLPVKKSRLAVQPFF